MRELKGNKGVGLSHHLQQEKY